MRITYGRTMYVALNSDELLDNIENSSLGRWGSGEGLCCASREELISFLDGVQEQGGVEKADEADRRVYDLLMDVNNKMEGEVGDIIFHN